MAIFLNILLLAIDVARLIFGVDFFILAQV